MSIESDKEAVASVLYLQSRARALGLELAFEDRPRNEFSPDTMAAVITRPGCYPDVFFTFAEAAAFMQGLAAERRMK